MSSIPDRDGPWPLVGRDDALDAVTGALHHPRVRAVLVHGPAGVGKSRLAEECLDRAARSGLRTARAVATAVASAVPLGALAHVIPAGTDLSDPVAGFAAVDAALSRDGGGRLVLLVDDLHLLDATSVMLLRQLMDSGTAVVVGTVRTGVPFELSAAFGNDDTVCRIDVEEFRPDEVAGVLRTVLGGPVSAHAVHELHTASGGNALYLRELVLGALRSGALHSDGEVWHLLKGLGSGTARLKELIATRLAHAPRSAVGAVELLALCEPVALTDIEEVAGAEEVLELERHGHIRLVRDHRRHTVVLTHPLYGEVVRASLPELRRKAILLSQAERVEARGARRQDDPLQLASWRLSATGTADPEQLELAAALARHSHDYPQVVRLSRALPADRHTVRNRLLLADALMELGRSAEAEDVLSEADALATTEEDRLAIVLAYSTNALWGMAHAGRAQEVTAAHGALLGSPRVRRILTINEGCIRTAIGRPGSGLELLEELGDAPGSPHDAPVWLGGAAVKTRALQMTGRIGQALAWAEHASSLHRGLERRPRRTALAAPHPAVQQAPVVLALAEDGRLAEARDLGLGLYSELVGSEAGLVRMWVAFFLARAEWLAGRVSAARRWYAECIALGRTRHRTRPMREALGGLAAAIALQGDAHGAAETLADLDRADDSMAEREYDTSVPSPGRALGEAWAMAATGRLEDARVTLLRAADGLEGTGNLSGQGMLLLDVARLGGAAIVADRLAGVAARSDGRLVHAHAELAAALAENDGVALLRLSERLAEMGCELSAAEAAGAAAAAFRRAGNPRSAAGAAVRSAALAEGCEGARTPLLAAAAMTVPLTRREAEIAWLAVSGATSPEIAGHLVLSVRTVNNHLGRVYEKLGVTSRRELARMLPALRSPKP
ncbi:LuxR C-terminal-related transcriptional regulator [Streptomyces antibioticus]|uniref:LuxR C-terminal-related transcriptional regulator n=1 Tax=Streptomyces antibioticus TaxID=1890 RepID=UPI0036D7DEBD